MSVRAVSALHRSRAAAFNDAARDSTAEFLVFTSEALEPIDNGWLDELLQPFTDKTAGIVSGSTYSSTSRGEHLGFFLHGSFLDKAYYRISRSERGQRAVLETIREVSAVDWQCLTIRRKTFDDVGGFDESLDHPWCVVDLCLKVAQIGLRTVVTPRAEFWEFSNDDDFAWYRQRAPRAFRVKWASSFADDPYRPKAPPRLSNESERPFWQPQRLHEFRK
jgi:GT2 family glycosyltransferase